MSTAISMRIYNTPTQSVTVYGKMYKLLEMSEKTTEKSPREINYTCNRNIKIFIYLASVCTLTHTHTYTHTQTHTGEWISLLGRVNGAQRDTAPPKWNPTSTTTAWKIIFHVSSHNAKNQPKCSTTKRKKKWRTWCIRIAVLVVRFVSMFTLNSFVGNVIFAFQIFGRHLIEIAVFPPRQLLKHNQL